MLRTIKALADEVFPDVVRLRRTIHRRPELAFEEVETAHLVTETLAPLGFHLRTGIAHTGVLATLVGDQPGPTRLLRADMDALPIHEENEVDYASERPGKMHACGHDAHTASLLGAAMILHRMKADLKGAVRFVFQPSEEVVPGGAHVMIDQGVLNEDAVSAAPSSVFGQHVLPELPVGKIGVRGSTFMASADEIHLKIHGQGGHAAAPHKLSADAVYVAAQVIVALQSVISRNSPPDVPSVLSFGRLLADGAANVIPDTVYLSGTFRAMDEAWRLRAHDLIVRVVEQTAQAFGARVDIDLRVGYPMLYNDPEMANRVQAAAVDYVGRDNVVEADLWFAAEDFAYFLRERPGTFYVLGIRNEARHITHGLHTPRFNLDEEALRIGPGFQAYLACMT